MQKVIAVVGPTASGKTSLGIFLAQKLGGEVISADSRQVYKGLDIGTGKVTKKEMGKVPHHLLDVAPPKRQFSAADFVRLAERVLSHIRENRRIPLVVGGTGFYTDTLLGRMVIPEVPPNPKLREQLEQKTTKQLFKQLRKLDPRRAATIEPGHKRRLIRAIEIALVLGRSPSKDETTSTTNNKYDVLWIGINPGEKKLTDNIHIRLLARMNVGMVAEAVRLHKAGLSYKRMDELGLEYRYLSLLLQKKLSREEFVEQLERAINHYAKRQVRWFKRNPQIRWVKNKTEALRLAKAFISG